MVDDCIDFIGGVVRLPRLLNKLKLAAKKNDELSARQSGGVTPQVISQLFNIPPNTYGSNRNNSQVCTNLLPPQSDESRSFLPV